MRERSRSAVFACRLQVITQTDTHTLQIHTLKMTEDITFNFVTATKVNDLKDYYESWAALYLVVRALNLPLDGHESDSRQKWLALGWVTIFRRAIHLDISPSHTGWEMSTGQSAVMLCSWGVKAGWLIPHVDKRESGSNTA